MNLKDLALELTPRSVKNLIPSEKNEVGFVKDLSSSIYSNAMGDITIRGVKEDEYEKIREEIISKLLKIRDENGEQVISEAHKREEVFHGPFTKRAGDILFLPNEGYLYSSKIREDYLLKPEEFDILRTGGHRPEGIIFGIGPDLAKGKKLEKTLTLWDVMPNILFLLNEKIPSYVDGKVCREIIDEKSSLFSKNIKIKNYSEKEMLRRKIKQKRSFLESKLNNRSVEDF